MSTPEEQAALQAAWAETVTPMDQVKTSTDPLNGWYDHTFLKLAPIFHKNGLYTIVATIRSHAKDTPGELPFERDWLFFIGSNKTGDPRAELPETRIKSFGYSRLKAIAEKCDVPTNPQPDAKLCAALVGKSWTQRIEIDVLSDKDKAEGKRAFPELGRNPVKLGLVPARIDGAAATIANGTAATAAPAAVSTVPAGTTFGQE
jgi:hypothetical protein